MAMIRGPRQIAPREKLAKFRRFAAPAAFSGSTLDRKSRAHALISIYSLLCPKPWRLDGGANRI
jgi:hypothetical protein